MPSKESDNFLLIVQMDVAPEHEAVFNEVYTEDHVPALITVPGVVSIRRYRRQPLRLALGGAVREMVFDAEPRYTAIYEVETPEVVISDAWAQAVDAGRWSSEVRPHTMNRRHTLHGPIAARRR